MRKITKHTAFLKPFATLAAMSAVTVAPLIGGSQVAQADPPNHAPAYGWRGDNNDDYDYRNGDDRDRDYPYNGGDGRGNSDRDGYVYGERSTLRGTVTRDLKGDYFELRADNGQVFRVLARNGEPTRLTANDRVQLSGYFDNNLFVADNINFLRDYGNNGNWNNGLSRKVNFPGRVVAIRSYTRLVVRGDNGHDYDVEISKGLSSSIRVGDRVRVAGRGEGNWVQANSVKR